MAKRTGPPLAQGGGEQVGKRPGKARMALYFIVIPLLFALTVFLIFAQLAGFSPFDKAKEWVGLESAQAGRADPKGLNDALDGRVVEQKEQLQEKEAQIAALQAKVSAAEMQNQKLASEQKQLLEQMSSLKKQGEVVQQKYSGLITTFERMKAKSAAPILLKMSDAEAARLLASLKPETVAKIYENMAPEQAAKFAALTSKNADS